MSRRMSCLLSLIVYLFLALSSATQKLPEAPIVVNGRTLFVLRSGVGSFSVRERANLVNQRLERVLMGAQGSLQTRIEKSDTGLMIIVGNQPVIAITDADAEADKVSRDELAARWSEAIAQALEVALKLRNRNTFWRKFAISALVLVGAVLLFMFFRRMHGQGRQVLDLKRERIPSLRLRGLELISAQRLFLVAGRCLTAAYVLAVLVVTVSTLLLLFAQFPETRGYAQQVALWIWQPVVSILQGIFGYLPKLFFILVILAVTRVVVRTVDFVARQTERGVISLEPWVHRDVVRPTAQILKAILIVLALFFIAPLIPGTGSTAAKGLSVIIGLMVSFGSSSTVGNLIAGVVLTYMRPYHLGDRVKLGETEGDVVERRFAYTKVVTIKNEEVIVPSLQALSGAIINYSARAKNAGLILHTSVTIGYDAPWRKVHELLIRAAEHTADVLKEPRPFVMQTALNDFFVSYQLNVYTNQASRKAMIYSELHQNIQDSFNEGGIEIMSPHCFQLRDGNNSTIPAECRGQDHEPRRFQVETYANGIPRAQQSTVASS